ncbi:MAG: glycosyltransferase family 4 protein [Magnetococcales bacterium]|nr:glycosyltransferase family 4 protein [Magnetococcales bacterium]
MTVNKNIVLVRQRFSAFGGAERFLDQALESLRQQGAELSIVTRSWQGGQATASGVVCNPFFIGRLWRDAGFVWQVCRLLSSWQGVLVQSHERLPCCDIYRAGDGVHAVWLQQRARVVSPLQRLFDRYAPYHLYTRLMERRLYHSPRLKAVICNSAMVKREIQQMFGVAEERLHVIYNGVDTARFHPSLREQHRQAVRDQWHIPAEAMLFLFLGSGYQRKGLSQAMAALAQQSQPSWLLVVGHDRKQQDYERQALRLGLADRVRFAGSQADAAPFYGAADAFVLPSLYDPFANAVLEAMAAGLPVMTSTSCGAVDLIVDGDNGYLLDALDETALALAMTRLQQIELRRCMGERARQTVLPLTFANMAERLLHLYNEVLSA